MQGCKDARIQGCDDTTFNEPDYVLKCAFWVMPGAHGMSLLHHALITIFATQHQICYCTSLHVDDALTTTAGNVRHS